MSKVEDEFMRLTMKVTLEKIEEVKKYGQSKYIKNYFACFQKTYPIYSIGMSESAFASYIVNWNANKHGIGEASQISILREKFPNIEQLPKSGEESLSLQRNKNDGSLYIGKDKSNIDGILTFDAINRYDRFTYKTILFLLKTIDIGAFSTSKGGGHQGTVFKEINTLIKEIGRSKILYEKNDVKIAIIVDGRSSNQIINTFKESIKDSVAIAIKTCDTINACEVICHLKKI